MQPLHEQDLTGHILEKAQETHAKFENVCLPMEYEPNRFVSTLGSGDRRIEPGELLWPERFPKKSVDDLKVFLGARGSAGQLQQRPAPAGGNIFKTSWWEGKNRYRGAPAFWNLTVGRWLSFDTALKDKEINDPTAYGVVELTRDYRLAIRNSTVRRLQFPQLSSEIEAAGKVWNSDGKLNGIIIEDKGSGTTALQTLRQGAPDWLAELLIAFMPQGSKEYRARQASLWCERDCILYPENIGEHEWWFEFQKELFAFPGAAHDDQVDWFTQIVLYLEHYLAEGWRLRNGL
jgi:predicted phage terminase large subunit-like protein